jgi:hypothetical protein
MTGEETRLAQRHKNKSKRETMLQNMYKNIR